MHEALLSCLALSSSVNGSLLAECQKIVWEFFLPTPIMSVGVGRAFGAYCLSVCLSAA